jgi:hypothetical protein
MHVGRKVRQQAGELREGLRAVQLVQIVDHQRDVAARIGELREYPVDHRLPIEVRRRCWQFRMAGGADRLADCGEQGKPELLAVLLVASHRHDGEAMRPARTVCPGAQQRSLPAARRGGDDRDLPRRRAIKSSEKITPVDQSGGAIVRGVRHSQCPKTYRRSHGPFGISPARVLSTRAG